MQSELFVQETRAGLRDAVSGWFDEETVNEAAAGIASHLRLGASPWVAVGRVIRTRSDIKKRIVRAISERLRLKKLQAA